MKRLLYLVIVLISCNNNTDNNGIINDTAKIGTTKNDEKQEICWEGTINSRIPVFVHYSIEDGLIIGEIKYLNTKDKKPIRLLGNVQNDSTYRLLEFDLKGNITGIITGLPNKNDFKGSWFSPKTEKELLLVLSAKDTMVKINKPKSKNDPIFGEYHYQYGENGFNGDFEIAKVDKNHITFNILSLTNVERGPNIAEVEKDTIKMNGNSFTYLIPGSDNCEFKATFYNDFVYVGYTKGYCASQFGLNATIDGFYIKTKD